MTVIAFKDTIPAGEPNPDIVETLEQLLADAKSGDLRAIAYATCRIGNVTGTGWEGSDGTRNPIAAAIMILGHRYAEALMDPE